MVIENGKGYRAEVTRYADGHYEFYVVDPHNEEWAQVYWSKFPVKYVEIREAAHVMVCTSDVREALTQTIGTRGEARLR